LIMRRLYKNKRESGKKQTRKYREIIQ